MTLSPKKTLIAIDIDGTLDRYGGPISQDTIRRLVYFAHVGLVSSRADVSKVAKMLGLGFAQTGKAKALEKYAQTYPEHLGKVYIADTELDDQEAKKVGWNFVYASDIKINLGCGYDLRRGYLNIDIREIKGEEDERSMDLKKFRKMKVHVREKTQKKKIVDYEKVLEEIKGRVVTYKEVRDLILRLFKEKEKFYYSEFYRFIETLQKRDDLRVETREDNFGRVYYLITEVKTEQS